MLSRLASYLKVTAGVAALLSNSAAWSQQLPTGGSVAAGSASIVQPNANTLNINQSTNQAIINWNSFSVGRGGTVNFNQPSSSSATLNRVLGSTPSWIAGTINAPGTVLLVNPNGIVITKSGVINTGSFAASTLNIKDSDFLSGNYKFTGNGGSAGVINAGHINVSDGGFAALLGGQVNNRGVISAKLGRVGLGAGELITLDLAGDGFLSVAVPSSQLGNLVSSSGALVSNKGKIIANGGMVFLSAATASNILRDAVNVPGSIRANSVGSHNGRIVINGGGGRVNITGRLAANGGKKHNGGSIRVSGASVTTSGKLSANGATGGSISVASGGDLAVTGTLAAKGSDGQGGQIILTGANVTVLGALIDASATGNGGTGGHVSVIAIDSAAVSGIIKAEGGEGGHGGFIETSGAHLHVADGTRVSTLARNGVAGTWLIDPNDFTVAASGGDITGALLSASLTGGNVVISSNDGGTSGNGDIFVNDAVSWTSANSLTFNAVRAITVNAPISLSIGTLNLNAAGGALAINAPINVNGAGTVTLAYDATSLNNFGFGNGASLTYNNADGAPATDVVAGQSLAINGQSYTLIYNMAQLDAVDGYDATAYVANTSIATYGAGLTGNYALAGNLVAPVTLYSAPLIAAKTTSTLDALDSPQFTGQFSGLGHRVDGLQMFSINPFNAGLFGVIGVGGVVSDLGVTNGRIFAGLNVGTVAAINLGTVVRAFGSGEISEGAQLNSGGLVGANQGVIANSSAATHMFGATNTGGLVGLNNGTIMASFATGNVEHQFANGGGLVGANSGSISDSYATGVVKGLFTMNGINQLDSDGTGGLAGFSTGTITNSYATGEVSGYFLIGGLVGWGGGSIVNSHATGNVTGLPFGVGDTSAQDVGGLVGQFTNTHGREVITNSYATGAVSGFGDNVGGLVGLLGSTQVSGSYATGDVHGALTNVGGLVGLAGGSTIDTSYATGNVSSPNRFVGGLIGFNYQTDVINSYATGSVSGFLYVGGLIGTIDILFPDFGSSTISRSYATGAVTSSTGTAGGLVGNSGLSGNLISQSYATGAVISLGGRSVGGLVGSNLGAIENSYGTGAVVNAGVATGGLVGFNIGTITSSYSTGAVANAGTSVGGFVGRNNGTIAFGAYDIETTGQATAIGTDFANQGANVIGYTTAQLQHDGLPAGFSSAVWSGGSGGLYPYLTALFSGGVQAVSGFAYADGGVTPLASGVNGPAYVSIASNGQTLGSVTTGANGYYYYLASAGSFGASGVAAYTLADSTTGATDAVSYASGTPGLVTGLNVSGGWRRDIVDASITTLSALDAGFATTTAGTPINGVSVGSRQINMTAAFAIDQALSVTDTLALDATAAVTQSAAITTPNLLLTGAGGAFTLIHSGNAVDTLAANTGSVDVMSNGALTISAGIANAAGVTTSGVTTTGNASIATAGDLTIAFGAAVAGANPVLATNGAFVNNAGDNAVTATSGRWLVYSADPANNVFGNLDSGHNAVWNTTYPALPPASATGNRYVFSFQPTLTFTSTDVLKTYGDDATAAVAAAYTVSGLQPGVANAFLADTAADVYSGAPSVTSTGSVATAAVAGSPYVITVAQGTMTMLTAYGAPVFNSAGLLTITTAPPSIPTSQTPPPANNPPDSNVNITFQNTNTGPTNISFTPPPPNTANNAPAGNGNDVAPAALPGGFESATNNGLVFKPIRQLDANQYSQFTLPDYADQGGEAAVFAMIARGVDSQDASDYLIDTFWNGTSGAWNSANTALAGKVTFSDGGGNTTAPTGNGFPIVAGSTDFSQLLKNGPVMISDGRQPAHWLLATQMTADGKGIVANDPVSGQQVALSYDASTKTVGGITNIFDAKGWVSIADEVNLKPGGLSALQSFVPSTFFAVTVK